MAKEQLTLEELAAKKVRRSNGWTRFWAIVLALVLVGAGTSFVSSKAKTAREEADAALLEQQEAIEEANANAQAAIGGSGTVVGGGDGTAAGGEVSSEAQAAVDAINAATAGRHQRGDGGGGERKLPLDARLRGQGHQRRQRDGNT